MNISDLNLTCDAQCLASSVEPLSSMGMIKVCAVVLVTLVIVAVIGVASKAP